MDGSYNHICGCFGRYVTNTSISFWGNLSPINDCSTKLRRRECNSRFGNLIPKQPAEKKNFNLFSCRRGCQSEPVDQALSLVADTPLASSRFSLRTPTAHVLIPKLLPMPHVPHVRYSCTNSTYGSITLNF
ncbi:hypothetical protein VNO77_31293 [Canavalia gladiata]|uniref:Uncharacterized protein n=1 Tax=Canavalia gladiata TaxID=3824 RepID=A0AAN9KSK5_CANGL